MPVEQSYFGAIFKFLASSALWVAITAPPIGELWFFQALRKIGFCDYQNSFKKSGNSHKVPPIWPKNSHNIGSAKMKCSRYEEIVLSILHNNKSIWFPYLTVDLKIFSFFVNSSKLSGFFTFHSRFCCMRGNRQQWCIGQVEVHRTGNFPPDRTGLIEAGYRPDRRTLSSTISDDTVFRIEQ